MSKYVRSLAFFATVGLALAPAAHAAQAVQHTLPPQVATQWSTLAAVALALKTYFGF